MFDQDKRHYLPNSEQKYSLDAFGNVHENEKIVATCGEMEKIITIKVRGSAYSLKVSSLFAACLFSIKIPFSGMCSVVLMGDVAEGMDKLYYRFREPVESPHHPGYYYIPYHTEQLINKDGVILYPSKRNRGEMRVRSWGISKPIPNKGITGGYRVGRIRKDVWGGSHSSRHRLLALTFLPYPSDPKELTVNHIDGIPGNDWISNLEWTTYSENLIHGYGLGLFDKKLVPLIHRNELTGVETRYRSIQECSDAVGLSHSTITSRLNKQTTTYRDGHRFKRDDGLPWLPVERVSSPSKRKPIIAKNVFTSEISIYETAERAGIVLGVNRESISFHCKNRLFTPIDGYCFRYLEDHTEWPVHTEYHLKCFKNKPHGLLPHGFFLLDRSENVVSFYEDISSLAKLNNLPVSSVARKIKNGEELNGFIVRRFDPKQPL